MSYFSTHIPKTEPVKYCLQEEGPRYIVNVGSMGMPRTSPVPDNPTHILLVNDEGKPKIVFKELQLKGEQ